MTRTKLAFTGALSLALVCGGLAVAQMPKDNVSGHKHPNLAAAQHLSRQAREKSQPRRRPTSGIWTATLPKPRNFWIR